jgi:hypothetical protein
MKAYWRSGCILHALLTSALGGAEWSASRPDHFIPRERTPGTRWIEDWMGPRAGLDAVVKISQPLPGLKPPIIQPVAQRYTTELSQLFLLVKMILQIIYSTIFTL